MGVYLCPPLALVSRPFLHHPYRLGNIPQVVDFMTLITAPPFIPWDTLNGAVTCKRLEMMEKKLKLGFCIAVVTVASVTCHHSESLTGHLLSCFETNDRKQLSL